MKDTFPLGIPESNKQVWGSISALLFRVSSILNSVRRLSVFFDFFSVQWTKEMIFLHMNKLSCQLIFFRYRRKTMKRSNFIKDPYSNKISIVINQIFKKKKKKSFAVSTIQ